MKQGKIVNINVKVKLNRIPSKAEKQKLVELIDNILDDGIGSAEYFLYMSDLNSGGKTSLNVDHHHVTIRKMGR